MATKYMELNEKLCENEIRDKAENLYLAPLVELTHSLKSNGKTAFKSDISDSGTGAKFQLSVKDEEFYCERVFDSGETKNIIYGGGRYGKQILVNSSRLPDAVFIIGKRLFLDEVQKESDILSYKETRFIGLVKDYAGELFGKAPLLEKFNRWQKKFGYDETAELWKDFHGGTEQLEWAIDNDIDCGDYDRWQALQRILKNGLSYDTANEIFNILYDKEDIEILDCE